MTQMTIRFHDTNEYAFLQTKRYSILFAFLVHKLIEYGQINTNCHRCNLALCALVQVAALDSPTPYNSIGTKTSIMKN